MNGILAKLLNKRGIGSVDKLSQEEKQTFEMYDRVLSRKELTLSDLKEFIGARINEIEMVWRDKNKSAEQKAELIPYHTVYKIIAQAINAPEAEREALERILLAQLQ